MSLVKKNIFILFIIQGTNYIFPLLTIPYLARIFGPAGIGALALAQAVILYLVFIIDFGFNLTVTRKVSIAYEKSDSKQINKLFTQTILIKTLIFLLVAILVVILCQIFAQLINIKLLLYIGFISLFGAVVNPIWLFQGIQRMKVLLIPTTLSKIISLVLIFVFVKEKSDINYAMFFTSLAAFLSGIISLFYVRKLNLAVFSKIDIKSTIDLIKESSYIFLSYLGSSLYTTMNIFIMSFFVGLKDIGIYSSADKITSTVQSLMGPVHQAIFPNLSSITNKEQYIIKFKKYGYMLFTISVVLSILLFIFSKSIVLIILGKDFYESYKILNVLSFLPVIISCGIIFGQWGLVVIGEAKLLGQIYVIGGLLHLTYVFILLQFYGIYGAAISILITEFIISILLFLAFKKKIPTWKVC